MPLLVSKYAGANLLYGYLSFITAALPALKNPIRMKVMYFLHFYIMEFQRNYVPLAGLGSAHSQSSRSDTFFRLYTLDIGMAL